MFAPDKSFQPTLAYGSKAGRVFQVLPFRVGLVLPARLETPARDKYSGLFGPFISSQEKSFVTLAPGTIFTTLHLIVTYKWAQ